MLRVVCGFKSRRATQVGFVVNPKKPRPNCLQCGKPTKRPESIYCNNKCQGDREYLVFIHNWKVGFEKGSTKGLVSSHIRRYLHEKYGAQCTQCGWSKVHPVTGLIPLTVDHKDGNSDNSVEANLDLLCPNCHSLTPTYGNLNRGNGRASRYKK